MKMPGFDFIKKNSKGELFALIITLLFTVTGSLASALDNNLLWILPLCLGFVVFAILSVDRLLMVTVFFVPLSIQMSYFHETAAFDVSLPTEPVLALLLLITLFKLIVTREFSLSVLKHPVTTVILIYLIWTLITAITSGMPLISFKTLSYRLWFIASFYLLAAQIFLKGGKAGNYILAYSLGLSLVVFFFLFRAGHSGFLNQKFAHSACYPFFKDHTSFGAALAFCIPPLLVISFSRNENRLKRMLSLFLFVFFSAALILSYSRAAWVSLLFSVAVAVILCFKLPEKVLVFLTAAAFTVLVFSAGSIWQRMDSTTEDSSTDLETHLKSSANITTDQSNLERINRWKSALRMFSEKPVLGWGPGTYQFFYAPFQYAEDKTLISTDFGDAGNSHSEYLGNLSESGLAGALLFLLIIVFAILAGIRALYLTDDRFIFFFIVSVFTGLLTYVIHGIMNSFLDTDKISALFWGYIAILTVMDIKTGGVKERGKRFRLFQRQE